MFDAVAHETSEPNEPELTELDASVLEQVAGGKAGTVPNFKPGTILNFYGAGDVDN